VLVVIGILTAITVPQFVRSIQGNRLRTAVRTVVMAGRYARSMAVLRQAELVLTFDFEERLVTVEEIVMRAVEPGNEAFDEDRGEADVFATQYAVASRTSLLRRRLEDVALSWVEVNGERFQRGSRSIVYSTNGRCTPYAVRVADLEGNDGVTIEVDALSSATTERKR